MFLQVSLSSSSSSEIISRDSSHRLAALLLDLDLDDLLLFDEVNFRAPFLPIFATCLVVPMAVLVPMIATVFVVSIAVLVTLLVI